jgi:hypothetical protein
LTAAAARADVNDRADVDAVLAHGKSTIRTELDQALADAAAEYRRSALSVLARSEPAEAEARLAYEAKMRSSAHRRQLAPRPRKPPPKSPSRPVSAPPGICRPLVRPRCAPGSMPTPPYRPHWWRRWPLR